MNLIEKFVSCITGADPFTFKDGDYWYHFIQDQVIETVKYIYGIKSYKDKNGHATIGNKPELVAIVSGEELLIIHIVDELFFSLYGINKEQLLANVCLLKDYAAELTQKAYSDLFPDFCEGIDLSKGPGLDAQRLRTDVRKYVFREKDPFNPHPAVIDQSDQIFDSEDAAAVLSEVSSFHDIAMAKFQENKNIWAFRKYRVNVFNEVLSADAAERWEIGLATAILKSGAKQVTVEFTRNGLTATNKIDASKLLRTLEEESYFSYWDFPTSAQGEQLLKALNIDDRNLTERLTCNDIKVVRYGRKVLFNRDNF